MVSLTADAGAGSHLAVDGRTYEVFRLDEIADVDALPYSRRILLENQLRHGGESAANALLSRARPGDPAGEVSFRPGRVLLQDSTGVAALVDMAAFRDAMAAVGADPAVIDLQLPGDLVIDHAIIAESAGTPQAFRYNAARELGRNAERYGFLRWSEQAFERLRVVPPNAGIVHQVNLEYLSEVIAVEPRSGGPPRAIPDSLVGLDSHTTMVNALGMLAWGVGGLEAEAVMLGQPISMLLPRVVGVRLEGERDPGTTATDLALQLTQVLRGHGVVGAFVEFWGPGVSGLSLESRATIANMSPEYGATTGLFPVDDETLRYLRITGRDTHRVRVVEAVTKELGLWHDPASTPGYDEVMAFDLGEVEPCVAGPSRPQDRITLAEVPPSLRGSVRDQQVDGGQGSDGAPARVHLEDGTITELRHGHVVIAAITSCANTSNPSVMLAAGLLAKNAVERGLTTAPWVKTSLAPGSKVVMDLYQRAGLLPYLEKLGFHLVGFGCTTCGGRSGSLAAPVHAAIADHDLAVASVLSGNRNFEGRINPDCRLNYLASPPLVVAFALAGSVELDLTSQPIGVDASGAPVHLRDIWPSDDSIAQVIEQALDPELFRHRYAQIFVGDPGWQHLESAQGPRFPWDPDSSYLVCPPYLQGLPDEPAPLADLRGARCLLLLGDSITTDHISPTSGIPRGSPAAEYLLARGVEEKDHNNFGSRRGNHEVMVRGTFGNVRLRNQLVPDVEGGITRHVPSGEVVSVFAASQRYHADGVPLIVLAGKEYGTGSSRDWAAKGTALLGVRAVLAESFERIHRTNLIGMGVLPLELPASAADLGLNGQDSFDIAGIADNGHGPGGLPETVNVTASGGHGEVQFEARVCIQTTVEADYYRHGGLLPYSFRRLRPDP